MVDSKITKLIDVMKKAEALALQLINVTRNLYIDALGSEQAQKVFEVMLDSFIVVDEIYYEGSHIEKPTIH